MTNMYMKRCITSLVVREKQIKATVRYYFKYTKIAVIKKTGNRKC